MHLKYIRRTALVVLLFFYCGNEFQIKAINPQSNTTSSKQATKNAGKALYTKHCMSCHQADGSGVPQMYPPLKKSNWVNGDKGKLIKVVLFGLEGEIDVNGESYYETMPKQDKLTDQQIADILSYIRKNFENHSDSIRSKDVQLLRTKKK